MAVTAIDGGMRRLRVIVAMAGGIYLLWWVLVAFLFPGPLDPLPGALVATGLNGMLLVATSQNRWVARHVLPLFTAWGCLLVLHSCYVLIEGHAATGLWMGTFVTFATVTLCQMLAQNVVLQAERARQQSQQSDEQRDALHARAVAEAANQELEAFSYSVAHDLRAPLRAIDGFTLVLLEEHGAALDVEAHDYLRRVRDCTVQMAQLIDGLLELGRLSRIGIRKLPIDLSQLARSTAARLKELEPDRTVEFVIPSGITDLGDATLLATAIENLLGNAWKFTRDRPNARIEFGSVQRSGRTEYFVRDNGVGFDMAFASKLFGVFQRLHPQREFEGSGVGLATVKRIVQRHGGRVWAEGKVGEGASFHFTIGDGT